MIDNGFLKTRLFVAILIGACIFSAFVPSVQAQDQTDADSDWRFSVSPYMWALSLEGDATVKGNYSDLDVKFKDILDELNFAGMVEFEAWKGNFGFYVSGVYGNLGNTTKINGIKIDPTIQTLWTGAGGGYYLGTWNLGDASDGNPSTLKADTYFGVRYTYLDVELDFKNGPQPDVQGDQDWFEPVLGLRTLWDLSDRWSLSVGGDVGGMAFGSDFAWGAFGLVNYRFNLFGNDNARFFVGYKAMSQDYEDGSGAKKFEWDVTAHGPVLGLTIPFGGKKAKAVAPPKDSDGDGVYDDMDRCPGTPTGVRVDNTGCPLDSDKDGVYDSVDRCPNTPTGIRVNRNGCPLDSDNDGIPDDLDKCPDTPKDVKVDRSGCPLDSDGDGVYDYLDECPNTPNGATVNEKGCWAFGGRVFFEFNKWELRPEAYPLMAEAIRILEENPEMRVEIQGHTDDRGPESYNQMLSEKRALAVRDYLIKNNIDSDRLKAKGFGESKPLFSNDTEEGRQKNRRVRFRRVD